MPYVKGKGYIRLSKVRQLVIEDNIPLPKYSRLRLKQATVNGALYDVAQEIKIGQSVVVPFGSVGKLTRLIRVNGLDTVSAKLKGTTDRRVWAILPKK